MNWKETKLSIQKQLLTRDLAKPEIRLNALERMESLIDKTYMDNPTQLLTLGKEKLINLLAKKKKLSGAELSVVNHIYDVLNGRPIPRRTPISK